MDAIGTPAPSALSVRSEVGDIPAIDGLRGVAATWVVLFHWRALRDASVLDPWIEAVAAIRPLDLIASNGYLGVDLFFLITGFLLTLPWFRHAVAGQPAPEARAFYARRARRILPAYYVHLVFLFFVVVPLIHPRLYLESTAFVAGNIGAHATFLHYTTPLTSSSLNVNGALWTLALEFQYYLLLPLVAPLFVKWPWRSLAAAALLAIGWRWLAANEFEAVVKSFLRLSARAGVPEERIRHLLGTQLPAYALHFALGILAGRLWLARRATAARASGLAAGALVAAALAALCAALSFGTAALGFAGWIVFPLALAGALAGAVSLPWPLADRLLASAPLAAVGRVSYSTYLWHLPLILLWNRYAPAAGAFDLPLFVVVLGGVSYLSYHFVEQPYMRLRQPLVRAGQAALLPIGAAAGGRG